MFADIAGGAIAGPARSSSCRAFTAATSTPIRQEDPQDAAPASNLDPRHPLTPRRAVSVLLRSRGANSPAVPGHSRTTPTRDGSGISDYVHVWTWLGLL